MTPAHAGTPIEESQYFPAPVCGRDCFVRTGKSFRYFSSGALFGRTTLPAASKNQARKMYQAAFPVSPGIGSAIGNDASTPSIARQPAITNKAIFGARVVTESLPNYSRKVSPDSMSYDGKSLLSAELQPKGPDFVTAFKLLIRLRI
jgi:hypothetical protein